MKSHLILFNSDKGKILISLFFLRTYNNMTIIRQMETEAKVYYHEHVIQVKITT